MITQGEPRPLITVCIVDDICVVRDVLMKSINRTRDLRCISAHATSEEALREIPRLNPRVVVMDVGLPELSGLECARRLKSVLPELLVLMLSVHSDGETVWHSLLGGADGYCVKDKGFANVPDALRALVGRGSFLCRQASEALVAFLHQVPRDRPSLTALTPREQEILGLLLNHNEKEIAGRLNLSVKTVHRYIETIYKQIGAHTRADAIRLFLGRR